MEGEIFKRPNGFDAKILHSGGTLLSPQLLVTVGQHLPLHKPRPCNRLQQSVETLNKLELFSLMSRLPRTRVSWGWCMRDRVLKVSCFFPESNARILPTPPHSNSGFAFSFVWWILCLDFLVEKQRIGVLRCLLQFGVIGLFFVVLDPLSFATLASIPGGLCDASILRMEGFFEQRGNGFICSSVRMGCLKVVAHFSGGGV